MKEKIISIFNELLKSNPLHNIINYVFITMLATIIKIWIIGINNSLFENFAMTFTASVVLLILTFQITAYFIKYAYYGIFFGCLAFFSIYSGYPVLLNITTATFTILVILNYLYFIYKKVRKNEN